MTDFGLSTPNIGSHYGPQQQAQPTHQTPPHHYGPRPVQQVEQPAEYNPEDCQVRVIRLEPVFHKGQGGWYKTYPGPDLANIETMIRHDYGAGRYRIEIVYEGAVIDERDVDIAGADSKDISGNVISQNAPSGNSGFQRQKFGVALDDPTHNYSDTQAMFQRMAILQDAAKKAQEEAREEKQRYEAKISELTHKLESKSTEITDLNIKLVRVESDNDHLKTILERDRQHNADRIEAARKTSSDPVQMMLIKHLLDASKAPGVAPKDPIEAARDAIALAKEVNSVTGPGEESGDGVAGILKEVKGMVEVFFTGNAPGELPQLTHNPSGEGQANADQGAEQKEIEVPAAPNVQGYATDGLRLHLQTGLEKLPDPAQWGFEAMTHITKQGREQAAAIAGTTDQQISQLEKWIGVAIPKIKPEKLKEILMSDTKRAAWFFKAIQYMKGYANHG